MISHPSERPGMGPAVLSRGELHEVYDKIRPLIHSRIDEFRKIRDCGSEEDIFWELVFCLLTPASRARSAWKAVRVLREERIIGPEGVDRERLTRELAVVRFKNNKARRVEEALRRFYTNGSYTVGKELGAHRDTAHKRDWLVHTVHGLGYKEASHFLRNIGFTDTAILDRHVLKNLRALSVIDEMPPSLTRVRYLQIEDRMRRFAMETNIPIDHLDFVLWYMETGEIFK